MAEQIQNIAEKKIETGVAGKVAVSSCQANLVAPEYTNFTRYFEDPDARTDVFQVVSPHGCAKQARGEACPMCSRIHSDKNRFAKPEEVQAMFYEKTDSTDRWKGINSDDFDKLVIGANGSIFAIAKDERDTYSGEITQEAFDVLLDEIAKVKQNHIVFETHAETIDNKILEKISEKLQGKEVSIEVGVETTSEEMRAKHKVKDDITNKQFKEAFDRVRDYGFGVSANVMVGIWEESQKVQLEDAINSLDYTLHEFAYGPKDEVVIFPFNLKPDTPLWDERVERNIKSVNAWMPIEVINESIKKGILNEQNIGKITFAWYGNKATTPNGRGEISEPPITCEKCKPTKEGGKFASGNILFYANFMNEKDPKRRLMMAQEFINTRNCDCYDKMMANIKQ